MISGMLGDAATAYRARSRSATYSLSGDTPTHRGAHRPTRSSSRPLDDSKAGERSALGCDLGRHGDRARLPVAHVALLGVAIEVGQPKIDVTLNGLDPRQVIGIESLGKR